MPSRNRAFCLRDRRGSERTQAEARHALDDNRATRIWKGRKL